MTSTQPTYDYTGQTACITGGATGIGAATATAFALAGANVVIADVATEAGHATADQIREAGGAARFVQCDVADADHVDALFESIQASESKLDFLLANAAVESTHKATDKRRLSTGITWSR